MSANAIETLRQKADLFVTTGLREIWHMLRRDPGVIELFVIGALVIAGRRDVADRRIAARREAGQ